MSAPMPSEERQVAESVFVVCPDCGKNVRRHSLDTHQDALAWHYLGWNGKCTRIDGGDHAQV